MKILRIKSKPLAIKRTPNQTKKAVYTFWLNMFIGKTHSVDLVDCPAPVPYLEKMAQMNEKWQIPQGNKYLLFVSAFSNNG